MMAKDMGRNKESEPLAGSPGVSHVLLHGGVRRRKNQALHDAETLVQYD